MNLFLFKKPLIITLTAFCFLSQAKAEAYLDQKLFMDKGFVYLLIFDEKVEKYSTGNTQTLDIELLTSISSDKHQMIIKPKESKDTNLIIWTKNGLYNFNLLIENTNSQKDKIIYIKKTEDDPELLKSTGGLNLDMPVIPKNKNVLNFEIDKPPMPIGVRKQ